MLSPRDDRSRDTREENPVEGAAVVASWSELSPNSMALILSAIVGAVASSWRRMEDADALTGETEVRYEFEDP